MKPLDESASAAGRVPADQLDQAPAAHGPTSGDGDPASAETQPGYYVRQWSEADQAVEPRPD